MNWKIPLASLEIGEAEREAVEHVLRSGWLSMGETTQKFERAFADFVGVRQAFAVANGTAALHLAVAALGLGPGDFVAVPALTFVASVSAVLYTGAEPLFVEVVGSNDLTLSPENLERRLTPRTRAVLVVHYGGYVCDMGAILAIARRHGLAVIEDAAHAPGAARDGRRAGAFGDVGCFSLFANKNLSTGEGGVVVTDRDDLAERIRLMRSHGMTTSTWDRWQGHAWSYDVVELGFNYRLDEMRAALGLVQLERVEAGNRRRAECAARYRELLAEVRGVTVPFSRYEGTSAHHLFPVLLRDSFTRAHVMEALARDGIQTSIHYPPVHLFQYYRKRFPHFAGTLPVTEDLAGRELTLPLYPSLGERNVETVVAALARALADRG